MEDFDPRVLNLGFGGSTLEARDYFSPAWRRRCIRARNPFQLDGEAAARQFEDLRIEFEVSPSKPRRRHCAAPSLNSMRTHLAPP